MTVGAKDSESKLLDQIVDKHLPFTFLLALKSEKKRVFNVLNSLNIAINYH